MSAVTWRKDARHTEIQYSASSNKMNCIGTKNCRCKHSRKRCSLVMKKKCSTFILYIEAVGVMVAQPVT